MKVTRDGPHPIRDTARNNSKPRSSATSAHCVMRFSVFSAGAGLRRHNSAQILGKNLELRRRNWRSHNPWKRIWPNTSSAMRWRTSFRRSTASAERSASARVRKSVSEPRRGAQARAGNVRIRLRRWSPGGGSGDGMPGIPEAPFIGAEDGVIDEDCIRKANDPGASSAGRSRNRGRSRRRHCHHRSARTERCTRRAKNCRLKHEGNAA